MAERPLTRIPSYKDNPKKVFELYREAGRIPTQFTSFEHAGAAFQAAMKSGLSAQKAREALGLTHKSVAGSYLFSKTPVLDSKKRPVPGQFSYFNPRAINEDIDPTTEMYVRRNYGDDAYTRFHSKLNQDWTQFSELERKQVQGLTGKQFHRGHGWAASARGGSVSQNNMYAEHGQRNVLHSSGDRWPDAVMRDLGIPKNNIEAYYADPNRNRLRTSHAVAMDDDWTAMNPDGMGFHRRPGSLNPFNAEILSDKLDQLEAQGLSREGIDRAIMERSATLSQSNSVSRSGPVRTTKVDPRAMGSVKVTKPTRVQLEAQRRAQAEAARVAAARYGIPLQTLDASYNSGLPGFGKQVGNLLKDNLGGSVAGLGVGLMTDPELHQAVSNKDGLKVAEYVARDTVGGAITQAAVRALPVAAGARIAAAANPVGATVLAASAPSSIDQGKQRERLMSHVNNLPAKKKQAAITQIKKDDKAAAKPLIDGDALLKQGINHGKWFLKQLGIKL
jgi:hypothetical protein